MGDVILTTPVLAVLRRVFPDAHLTYLTEKPFTPLLEHHPHIDRVISLDYTRSAGESMFQWWLRQFRLFKRLRQEHFDLVIDLFGNPRSALLTRATGAPYRVGGDFRGRGRLYSIRVPQDRQQVDAIEFHFKSLRILGIHPEEWLSADQLKKTKIYVTADETRWAKSYLAALGLDENHPIAILHPGATWPNKRWPVEKFAALAGKLAESGYGTLLSVGPGEEDLARRVARLAARPVVVGRVLPLRHLAAVIRQANLLISNDCGVMHLGAAVGTMTIGIFGPGEPEIWFPYTQPHRAFWSDIDCRPCHQNECPLGTLECMQRIHPEHIMEYITKHLPVPGMAGK